MTMWVMAVVEVAPLRQKAGRITAAGSTIDVVFGPVEGPVNERVDDARARRDRH